MGNKAQYRLPLLAVADVERSKRFYAQLFGVSVSMDLGWNVTFDAGFAIQQEFARITGVEPDTVVGRSHNMELYFETEDFDGFLEELSAHPEVELVHPPKKYDWQQRVVRIYDPDGHMIEVGEDMESIARRYLREGRTAEETAVIIQHPVEFVEQAEKTL